MDPKVIEAVSEFAWPLLVAVLAGAFWRPLLRLVYALVRRIERGDEVKTRWITLGKSAGPLKSPDGGAPVTDDSLALIHRSWRVPERDAEFGGQKMYQIHVILFGPKEALDRVEYVLYRLNPAYPKPVQTGGARDRNFELKELANGYSQIRGEVRIRDQEQPIHLSRFIDLTDKSPELEGDYF